MLGEDLQGAQLVAAAPDRDALVQRPDAAHLELPKDCKAIIGDRGTDARDHRVIGGDRRAVVEHLRTVAGDMDRAAQRVGRGRLAARPGHARSAPPRRSRRRARKPMRQTKPKPRPLPSVAPTASSSRSSPKAPRLRLPKRRPTTRTTILKRPKLPHPRRKRRKSPPSRLRSIGLRR